MSIIEYQQLFEIDELFVVVLRHLMDDKKSINQLLLTAKWLSKRLYSTALWMNQGILFYRHNENIITSKMLWHLLRERQFELDLNQFQNITQERDNTDALKHLINLSRSNAEARSMIAHGLLEAALYEIIGWHDRPKHQELTCVLLAKLVKVARQDGYTPYAYVPVLVEIIQEYQDHLDQSFGVSVCKALRQFLLLGAGITETVCQQLNLLAPIITRLMTHDNIDLQKAGFTIAGTIGCGESTNELTSQQDFWKVLINGLSNKTNSIRRDTAWSLSNLALESVEYRSHIATEEVLQKLLVLRSDSIMVTYEVLWVFRSLADNTPLMNESQRQLLHDHFDDLLDFSEKIVELSMKTKLTKKYTKSLGYTIDFISSLLGALEMKLLPNNEILQRKFLQSSLLQRLRTLDELPSTFLDRLKTCELINSEK